MDSELQRETKTAIANGAGVEEEQVTILGTEESIADSSIRRHLLQTMGLVVRYEVDVEDEMSAYEVVAKVNVAAMMMTTTDEGAFRGLEAYLQAINPDASLSVSEPITVEIVNNSEAESEGGLGIEVFAAIGGAGVLVAIGGGYFVYNKLKGMRHQNSSSHLEDTFAHQNSQFGQFELTINTEGVESKSEGELQSGIV